MPQSVDVSSYKPGQSLSCVIARAPRTDDQRDTIARLMRLDPANRKALRTAQRMRRQRVVVYNRGNRDWTKRETTAKVVSVVKGAAWKLPYNLDLRDDLASVADFLTISAK